VSSPSVFSLQFKRFEPSNIISVEEHESNHSRLFVYFERMSAKNSSLQNNTVWVDRKQTACCNKILKTKNKRVVRISSRLLIIGVENTSVPLVFGLKTKHDAGGNMIGAKKVATIIPSGWKYLSYCKIKKLIILELK